MSDEELTKSSNPGMNTAFETIETAAAVHGDADPDPVYTISTGHEGSVGDQVRATVQRVRGGEMGMLPGHRRPGGARPSCSGS